MIQSQNYIVRIYAPKYTQIQHTTHDSWNLRFCNQMATRLSKLSQKVYEIPINLLFLLT